MFDLSSVKLDPVKLERGTWWEVFRTADGRIDGTYVETPDPDKPAMLIVPAGIAYERALDEAQEPYLSAIRDGKLSDVDRLKIQGQALSRSVLRGWQNISMRGEPIVWTEDKAAELLCDAAWQSLHDFVIGAARIRAAAAAREEDAAAGN